jgi:hypothetical protein
MRHGQLPVATPNAATGFPLNLCILSKLPSGVPLEATRVQAQHLMTSRTASKRIVPLVGYATPIRPSNHDMIYTALLGAMTFFMLIGTGEMFVLARSGKPNSAWTFNPDRFDLSPISAFLDRGPNHSNCVAGPPQVGDGRAKRRRSRPFSFRHSARHLWTPQGR